MKKQEMNRKLYVRPAIEVSQVALGALLAGSANVSLEPPEEDPNGDEQPDFNYPDNPAKPHSVWD